MQSVSTIVSVADSTLSGKRILVVGVGGVGCEVLKNVALSGCDDIVIVDMDIVEYTNLNRQLLYRVLDIGKSKALVAADYLRSEFPRIHALHGLHKSLEELPEEFYWEFDVIFACLDTVVARRALNSRVFSALKFHNKNVLLIDCGTEGYQGHVRIIIPYKFACIECTSSFYSQRQYPVCTLTSNIRRPEHCIELARSIDYPTTFPNDNMDVNSEQDMQFIKNKANLYSSKHGFGEISLKNVKDYLTEIIPSVSTTNSIVAALAVNEAIKGCMDYSHQCNFIMYNGTSGIYMQQFFISRLEDCIVCGAVAKTIQIQQQNNLRDFLNKIQAEFQLVHPSIRTASKTLYMSRPDQLKRATSPNLDLSLSDLLENDCTVYVTDDNVQFYVKIEFLK